MDVDEVDTTGAQRFPSQNGVCSITSCVGLRGMAGRQCDTGARALLGANGLRSLIGLPEPTGYVYALKRWRQVQFDPGIFWSRWRSDYLLTLEHWHGGCCIGKQRPHKKSEDPGWKLCGPRRRPIRTCS